jgi:hypothetical protein
MIRAYARNVDSFRTFILLSKAAETFDAHAVAPVENKAYTDQESP